jgi:hypothetical protein
MTSHWMFARAGRWLAALALATLLPAHGAAQTKLFRSDSVLPITLRFDVRALFRDRDTTKKVWRDATLVYAESGGAITIPVRMRTRGIYRLKTCDDPPIRLAFDDSTARGTLFKGLHHPKLIVPCRSGNDYEQLILQEYGIYRVQRLLTPVSLSARLLRVTFEDVSGRTRPLTQYAFITEDPERLARRLGGTVDKAGGVSVADLATSNAALLLVFQYFIGNTDWSLPGLHNATTIMVQDSLLPLVWDFDWSGVVDAPYATPDPRLGIKKVRERIWWWHCMSAEELEPALARFESLRDSITALVQSIPGLTPREVQRTLSYYDEFYRAIADRARFVRRVVQRDCRQ